MYKYLLFVIFVIVVSQTARAQVYTPKTSAEYFSLINKSKPDTGRINLYFGLGVFYRSKIIRISSPPHIFKDSVAWAATQGIRLADSLHSEHLLLRLKRLLALSFFYKGDIEKGGKLFTEVIDYYRKRGDKENELTTWRLMLEGRQKTKESFNDIYTYLYNSLQLYQSLGDNENQANQFLQMADLHLIMARIEDAENEALQALHIYQEINYRKQFDTYYLLSVINRNQGDLDQALFFAMRCVQNLDSLQDKKLNPTIFYGEVALVYDGLGQAEESSKWYRQTLDERQKRGEQPIIILRTAGLLIHQLVKINKRQEAFSLIINLRKQYPPRSEVEEAATAQNLAYCYESLGNYPKAESHYLKMASYVEANYNGDEFTSMAFEDLGNFYLKIKKYEKAVTYLLKALNPANSPLASRQRDLYLSMYTADSSLGNYLAAINDFRSYKMLTDSLFSERKIHQIEELQIKYQTEKKEKDIILLNIQNKAQENKLQRSALVRNFIIAGVLLLAAFVYYRYRLKSISNKNMIAQQKLINQKNQSLTQLLTEKEWLVKEIHHRVKNNFHMVMGLLATQSEFLKNPEAISAMRESRHRIHAMSIIHQTLYQSDNLSTISMPAYIHELASSLRESFSIPGNLHFSFDIDPVDLDLSHAIPLGLILNEAITNAIKYAFPDGREGKLLITLKQLEGTDIIATVSDNGIGLPTSPALNGHSMGMKLIKGLSEDMEGVLTISGDAGTTIRIQFNNSSEKTERS